VTPSIAVVDASVLGALAFFEPEALVARNRLRGRQLVAPHLLVFEMLSIGRKKLRRHPDQERLIHTGLESVLGEDFTIFWSDVEPTEVFALSLETGLTPYDASYVWLARHLGAELLTFDARMQAAADGLP
jgi:predicted nucleic acid-binding protein